MIFLKLRGELMAKNAWFKHYNAASEGLSMKNATASGDYQAIVMFWTILELISRYEKRDESVGTISISPKVLTSIFGINERGLVTCLTKVSRYFGDNLLITWSKLPPNTLETEVSVSCKFVHICCRNWLELQENRGGKREAKKEQKTTEERREKREERDKKKEEDLNTVSSEAKNSLPSLHQQKTVSLIKISDSKNVSIKNDLIVSWADTYPKEFLEEELKKARNWILSNGHKAPKSAWGRFFNSWFARAWEKYRTTLKSNPVKITVDDLDEMLGGLGA